MNKFSLTQGGILVMVLGYTLVNTLGFSENCSSEITSRVVEYVPILAGAVTAWFGRFRRGDLTLAGFRK